MSLIDSVELTKLFSIKMIMLIWHNFFSVYFTFLYLIFNSHLSNNVFNNIYLFEYLDETFKFKK